VGLIWDVRLPADLPRRPELILVSEIAIAKGDHQSTLISGTHVLTT